MGNKLKPKNKKQTRYSVPMYPDTIEILKSRKLKSGKTWDGFISELLKISKVGE